jgi:hypothetical protein
MQAELNGETRLVMRRRRGVIWCPFCDRSRQEEGITMWCDGCNAQFVDEVTPELTPHLDDFTEEAAPAPRRRRRSA